MTILRLTFKDPDHHVEPGQGLEPRPLTAAEAKAKAKFIEFDEYLVVEIDTAKRTARVIPVDRSDYDA